MVALQNLGRVMGVACTAIGGVQLLAGVRGEPGMTGDATVDSHVRFMGPVFAGYGLGWFNSASGRKPAVAQMRIYAGLMALGGVGRLVTRATMGRPHRFHDVLLVIELSAPLMVELAHRADQRTSSTSSSAN